ncbi:MAG: hypothetical protein ACHQM6_11115 [Candidatus Kapaibacterium sp.]
MNKRDTIMVVFRVIAIFFIFFVVALLPNVYYEFSREGLGSSTLTSKFIVTIFTLGIPAGMAYLLWNRSGWVADKILAPFGMDELWDDEPIEEIPDQEIIAEEEFPEPVHVPFQESTITHLTKDEIEDLVLTSISILILFNSLPDLLRILYLFIVDPHMVLSPLIAPLVKTLLAAWLFFRTNNLSSWFRRWRKLRMEE